MIQRLTTGTEAVKALGESSFAHDTHFVLYSCLHEDELRRLVNECEADDYLSKGLESDEMLTATADPPPGFFGWNAR